MSKGHVGPHLVGDPYHPLVTWPQNHPKCVEHDFMKNQTWNAGYVGRENNMEWIAARLRRYLPLIL